MKPNQQAKCEECGSIFTLGLNGIDRNGHDLCDACAKVVRWYRGGPIAFDPADTLADSEQRADPPLRIGGQING